MSEQTIAVWTCTHCGQSIMTGSVHYCPVPRFTSVYNYETPQPLTEADVRRIVREEIARAELEREGRGK